jgi:hypothetical protein
VTAVLAQEPSEPAGKLCQITERPFEPVVVTVLGRIKPAAFQTDCARFSLTPMKFGTMQLTTGLGVAVGSGVGVGIGVGVRVGVGVAEGVGAGVEVGVGVAVGVGVGVGLGLPPGTRGCGYVYAV